MVTIAAADPLLCHEQDFVSTALFWDEKKFLPIENWTQTILLGESKEAM